MNATEKLRAEARRAQKSGRITDASHRSMVAYILSEFYRYDTGAREDPIDILESRLKEILRTYRNKEAS